ncbi:GtrA family protein [Yersinia massiliensis]|uniref:GtrA family protein n=1 Tax=Yersinia massiliensis TaxID=419257 RepID=UPI0011A5767C|nr:GtrA family protein [Yersinia massiliensis]
MYRKKTVIQFIKFFINGGVLGLAAWGLQWIAYMGINGSTSVDYSIASALAYIPLVCVNFIIQRRWIFNREGVFLRFIAANLIMMVFVSLLSPLCRDVINYIFEHPWGDITGFAVASLISSIPSFLLMRFLVFGSKV